MLKCLGTAKKRTIQIRFFRILKNIIKKTFNYILIIITFALSTFY